MPKALPTDKDGHLDFASIELLNALTYYNYGQLTSVHCSDLSESNRLALCTDKCLFLLNFNFMWPLSTLNCSPAKFLNDTNQEPSVCKARSTVSLEAQASVMRNSDKSKLQIETWRHDLSDAQNEAFYVNVVCGLKKSQLILDVYMKFFDVEQIVEKKPKSFHRILRDSVIANKKYITPEKNEEEAVQSLDDLKNSNREQYGLHKYIGDQTIMLDAYYCEYLGVVAF